MASTSAHFNLTKPATTDYYNIGVFNDNTDIIDTQMYNNQVSAAKIMVGATANDDGESGRVPVPHAGDQNKYLCADGTWKTVSGGGGAGADEMTLDEYNALTTVQKNDGTIRFIPQNSSSGTETAVDMSSIGTPYCQASMSITATSSTETTVTFGGGTAIGCNFNYLNPIDVTNISTITFKATNGSCYGGGAQAQRTNWNLQIGLTSTAIGDQPLDITAGDSRWAVVADMPLANHVYEETLDVSQLTGNYYLLVVAHGWNTVVEDITLHAGGAYPSQIKYMDKTYGIGGSASSHAYSTTEQIVGTWIDGSDVYEKTISISNISLSSGSYETVDTITGLDTIISCNGYAVEGNLKYTLNDITLRVIQDGTSVKLYSPSGTTWTISSGAIIIRYIKASS